MLNRRVFLRLMALPICATLVSFPLGVSAQSSQRLPVPVISCKTMSDGRRLCHSSRERVASGRLPNSKPPPTSGAKNSNLVVPSVQPLTTAAVNLGQSVQPPPLNIRSKRVQQFAANKSKGGDPLQGASFAVFGSPKAGEPATGAVTLKNGVKKFVTYRPGPNGQITALVELKTRQLRVGNKADQNSKKALEAIGVQQNLAVQSYAVQVFPKRSGNTGEGSSLAQTVAGEPIFRSRPIPASAASKVLGSPSLPSGIPKGIKDSFNWCGTIRDPDWRPERNLGGTVPGSSQGGSSSGDPCQHYTVCRDPGPGVYPDPKIYGCFAETYCPPDNTGGNSSGCPDGKPMLCKGASTAGVAAPGGPDCWCDGDSATGDGGGSGNGRGTGGQDPDVNPPSGPGDCQKAIVCVDPPPGMRNPNPGDYGCKEEEICPGSNPPSSSDGCRTEEICDDPATRSGCKKVQFCPGTDSGGASGGSGTSCLPEKMVCVKVLPGSGYTGPDCFCPGKRPKEHDGFQGDDPWQPPDQQLPEGDPNSGGSVSSGGGDTSGGSGTSPRECPDGSPSFCAAAMPGGPEQCGFCRGDPLPPSFFSGSGTGSSGPGTGSAPRCGNGICEDIVCMAIGCPSPETAESCPEDCA